MRNLAAGILLLALTAPVRGDLLLAAFGGDQIRRFDGTATTTLFASDPGGANAMDGPTAMVYDASGNLLVLNEFSGNVLKFDGTTGAFISNFIPNSSLVVGTGMPDPADMEMGADGNLYIMGHGAVGLNAIHKFSGTTGAYLGAFSTVGADRHQHGLAFGPGGDLYQGIVDARAVHRFDKTTGAFVSTFATGPIGGPSDMFPIGDLAFGPSTMYVTIDGTKGVARFTTTPVTGTFTGYLTGTTGSTYWGLLVDGSTLYVSNLTAGSIQTFDAATGAPTGSPVVIGGGAFDILAMPVPEPSMLLLSTLMLGGIVGRRFRVVR